MNQSFLICVLILSGMEAITRMKKIFDRAPYQVVHSLKLLAYTSLTAWTWLLYSQGA